MTAVKVWPLFLLPFSLVSMVKDCSLPNLNGQVVLSSESILKNSFPDNSQASVECAKGYQRKDGLPSITCLNGVWSEVELKCQKMDCGLPESLPHMTYRIDEGTLFGAYIQPVCERGYDVEGTAHRQCLVNGWSGKAECLLTTCEFPDQIEHGNIIAPRDEPVFNDVITFSCDENYILVGNSFITCSDYGEYSSPPPKCEAIKCPVPEISFGNKTEGNPPYFYKSEVKFECWPGYMMEGSATSVCEKNVWTPLPICVEVIITPTEASTTTNKVTTIGTITTASTLSHGKHDEQPLPIPDKRSNYYCAIVIGTEIVIVAIVVLLVGCVVCLACYIYIFKRKGSYDTGEELRTKGEFLLNQSV